MNDSPIRQNASAVQELVVIHGYKDSGEAALRKLVRSNIRKGPFTKGERDVILAIVNLWFYHRNGRKGYIHPGRKKLAKNAGVCEATVKRCLAMLRDVGVVVPLANLRGQGQKPTCYIVELKALFSLCGVDIPTALEGHLEPVFGGSNAPPLSCKMTHHWRVKMTHSYIDTQNPPSQGMIVAVDGGAK